jgi:hypothetical protein
MVNTEHAPSRSDLDVARREFNRWRRTRPRGARIPEALWRRALDLAHEHGVSRTSQTLGLDYYGVKRRLASAPDGPEAKGKAAANVEFVELSLPASRSAARCHLEMRGTAGDGLRIEVTGLSVEDLAAFVRAVAGPHSCCK